MTVLAINDPTYARVVQFLYDEAALLDARRFEEWLGFLTEDIAYRVPVPLVSDGGEPSYAQDGHFFHDNLSSLTQRVRRLATGFAWAEDPPSRTCRLVSNIRVETDSKSDGLRATSNFLIYRSRADVPHPDVLAGERHDILRETGGRLKLARREVLLAQAVLGLPSLSFFL